MPDSTDSGILTGSSPHQRGVYREREKAMTEYRFTAKQMVKIEALNIASREAVSRSYEKPTIDIAREMVEFIGEE